MTTPSLPCPGTPSLPCHGAGDEAVHFIDSGQDADLMLLDITMPVKSGLEVMQDVGHHLPHYPIVRRVAQEWHKSGTSAWLGQASCTPASALYPPASSAWAMGLCAVLPSGVRVAVVPGSAAK